MGWSGRGVVGAPAGGAACDVSTPHGAQQEASPQRCSAAQGLPKGCPSCARNPAFPAKTGENSHPVSWAPVTRRDFRVFYHVSFCSQKLRQPILCRAVRVCGQRLPGGGKSRSMFSQSFEQPFANKLAVKTCTADFFFFCSRMDSTARMARSSSRSSRASRQDPFKARFGCATTVSFACGDGCGGGRAVSTDSRMHGYTR